MLNNYDGEGVCDAAFVRLAGPFDDGSRRLRRPTEPHQTEAVDALMCAAPRC